MGRRLRRAGRGRLRHGRRRAATSTTTAGPTSSTTTCRSQIWAPLPERGRHALPLRLARAPGSRACRRRFSGWSNELRRLRQRRLEGHLLGERRRRLPRPRTPRSTTRCSTTSTARCSRTSPRGSGPTSSPKGYQRGSAFGDLNGDGFPDLVVTSLNKRPRILLNSRRQRQPLAAGSTSSGAKSNRDGDRREGEGHDGDRAACSTTTSSVERRLHVLERPARALRARRARPAVRSLEIRWPSGTTCRRSRT